MAEVHYSTTIDAPADAVWDTLRAFSDLETYFPVFTRSTTDGKGVGATRVLYLADGGEFHERLETLNDEARTLTYRTLRSPLPIENYLGTVKVEDLGEGRSKVEWSCTFDASAEVEPSMKEMFANAYRNGIDGLEKLHKS
jgi:uncharacterized protein YndB with AHSA1/START domain